MLNRGARLGRGLVALVTVLSLTAGSLLALSAPAVAQSETYSTASAVPAEAVLYSAFDLDLESAQWQQVDELLGRLGVPDALSELRTSMLNDAEGELTEEELDAFLGGEAGFYVLPSAIESMFEQFEALNEELTDMAAASPEAMQDMDAADVPDIEVTGVGAIIAPSDPDLAWDYINRQIGSMTNGTETQVEEVTEDEVTILTITPSSESESEVVVAYNGEIMIIGGNIIDVQTAIDTANGDAEALADLDPFSAVVAELPGESISFTYYDNSQVMGALGENFLEGFYSVSPELAASADAEYFGGVALWADTDGFRVDAVSIPAEGTDLSAMVPEGVVTSHERVPAETTVFFGAVVPDGTWNAAAISAAQAVNAGMTGEQPDMQSLDEMFSEESIQQQLDQAEQILGFNLLDDFFGQFSGETAFAMTFPNLMTMGSLSVDTVFVTELDDAAPVAESIEKLVRMASSMAGDELAVTTREVGDDTLYVIGDPETTGIPAIEVGVVENNLVIGSGAGVTGFLESVENPLSEDEQFNDALGLLGGENYYQVAFVDLTDILPTVMALSGGMGEGASGIEDSDPACLEFSSQEDAQAAFDEDTFANSNLDQDFDGEACEDLFAPAVAEASPTAPSGSVEALHAFAAVAYESGGYLYSSAILTVAETDE